MTRQNIAGNTFGSTGGITDPGDPKTKLGHVDEIVPFQNENFWQNRQDEMLAHLEVYGIPVWDIATTYILNSYVVGSDGVIYRSILAPFIGLDPTSSPSQWVKAFVDYDTVETITAIKTFDALKLGGNQDANNNKITLLATPTSNQDAANKAYVDGVDAANSVTDQGYTDTEVANKIDKDGTTAYIGTGVGFKDEDDMASDSAVATASQQSIKAFVESKRVGDIIQEVHTITGTRILCTGTIPWDNTIPASSEGTEVMTLAITPTNASNLLKIEVVSHLARGSGVSNVAALFQDTGASAIAVGASEQGGNSRPCNIKFTYWMIAGTTIATTFKVRCGSDAGNSYFNGNSTISLYGGTFASSITITETKQ